MSSIYLGGNAYLLHISKRYYSKVSPCLIIYRVNITLSDDLLCVITIDRACWGILLWHLITRHLFIIICWLGLYIQYTAHTNYVLIISNLYLITCWPGLCRNFDRQGLNMPPYQRNLKIMTELSINCDSWVWLDHIDQGLKRALVPLYLDLISPCSHYRQSHRTGLLEHFLRTGEASYLLALWKLPKIWSNYLKSLGPVPSYRRQT